MRLHLLFLILTQTSSLTHILHDLEGVDRFELLVKQIGHDIVTASDDFADRVSRPDKILGVAAPYVRTVGKT